MKNKIKKYKSSERPNVQTSKLHMSRGFSLIEVLVSISIFALAMTMMTGGFSSFLKSYSNARKIQKDIGNAQYVMNVMAKTIRTSDVLAAGGSLDLHLYDYSQDKCIWYRFISNKIQERISTQSDVTQVADCVWSGTDVTNYLTSNNIFSASVSAIPSAAGTTLGRVTVVLSVRDPSGTTSAIPIQMSVSLRR